MGFIKKTREAEFAKKAEVLLRKYAAELSSLAHAPAQISADIASLTKRRHKILRERATAILEQFDEVHLRWEGEYIALWARYHDLQPVQKKALTKKALVSLKQDIEGSLEILRTKAKVSLKDIKRESVEIKPTAKKKLTKLTKLTFSNLTEAWFNFVHPLTGEELPDLPDED